MLTTIKNFPTSRSFAENWLPDARQEKKSCQSWGVCGRCSNTNKGSTGGVGAGITINPQGRLEHY